MNVCKRKHLGIPKRKISFRGVSILFSIKWKPQDTSISAPVLGEKVCVGLYMHAPCVPAWMCACMQVSTSSSPQVPEHCEMNSPELLSLLEVSLNLWILPRDVQSWIPRRLKLIDRTLTNSTLCYPALPQCHLRSMRLRLYVAWSGHKDLWGYTAYHNNVGRLSQVEKDKLHVTCITLFGCPDRWREPAVSWAQMGTQEALVGIVSGGRHKLNWH